MPIPSSTCPAAPGAHVSHVGPLVGGGVVLLHRAQALPRCSIVASHGVELPCSRHKAHITVTPRGTHPARGTCLNLLGCLGKSLAKGSAADSQAGVAVELLNCQQHKDTTQRLNQKSQPRGFFKLLVGPGEEGLSKCVLLMEGSPCSGVLSKAVTAH